MGVDLDQGKDPPREEPDIWEKPESQACAVCEIRGRDQAQGIDPLKGHEHTNTAVTYIMFPNHWVTAPSITMSPRTVALWRII